MSRTLRPVRLDRRHAPRSPVLGAPILRATGRWAIRLRLFWFLIVAALFLTGCVRYDIGITYRDQHHGEIVQHIQLAERLTNFSRDVTQTWLDSIRTRTQALGGRIQRVSDQELVARIPFNNGQDLAQKFNTFFQPAPTSDAAVAEAQSESKSFANFPDLSSKLMLQESNFLLVLRDRLTYDVDLRSLKALSSQGNLLLHSGSLLNLTFSLDTPWGARVVDQSGLASQNGVQQGQHIVWTLEPGELNHLDVVFWVPSPLGVGTGIIVALVAIAAVLRQQLFPTYPGLAQPEE